MDTFAHHLLWFLPMLWLGMVLAISFLEAPLKFRAPGVTVPLGLGIGRIVFKALNTAETVWAVLLLIACVVLGPSNSVWVWLGVAVAALAIQLVAIRPPLTRRSNQVLAAGEDLPRSTVHYYYVAFEVVKVIALIGLAIVAAP
ncbi:hypothetical protein IU449_13425 [Nocardia higoensis]|uniref:Transmembrane protein n=1 Tax=Nocardia higoensis TaxID=228599 RepID=A0ABS0DAP1_9NOCA|nr:hypothetical protein [Nocardia higoensis]MBF6355531.1 hypothetical protein [Nocardia higoensis]